MNKFTHFSVYVLDCETTSLLPEGEIIELSIKRLNDEAHKTWCIKPDRHEAIQAEALKINGHKLEDITHLTDYGKATYLPKNDVIVSVENWLLEDRFLPEERIMVGQNIKFDLKFLERLWEDCSAISTFPFGKRPFLIDTQTLALFFDLCEDTRQEFYNLKSLVKKYGIKNEKAHTAESDVNATAKLFLKQLEIGQKFFSK